MNTERVKLFNLLFTVIEACGECNLSLHYFTVVPKLVGLLIVAFVYLFSHFSSVPRSTHPSVGQTPLFVVSFALIGCLSL